MLTTRALCFLLLLSACSTTTRKPAPPHSELAGPYGLLPQVRWVGIDEHRFETDSPRLLERVRAAATDGALDILALSGGGAGGAFGAGALVGMTRRGQRPQFEVVTGVSAGALVAPFAFLGSSWDARMAEAFMQIGDARLLRRRGLRGYRAPSIYRGQPLAAFIREVMSDELIDAVAREARTGRLLLVATTDLDRQATVIWSLGAIAIDGRPAARRLFRDVITASASIPGVFPPVMIRVEDASGNHEEMHVDGGATIPFFFTPEVAYILPGSHPELRDANLFVLMNAKMGGSTETVAPLAATIASRSSSAVLTQMARTSVQLAAAFAAENGMTFHLTEIPADYPYAGSIEFKPANMRPLFEYGARCAQEGLLWTTPAEALARARRVGGVGGVVECPGAP